MDQRGKLISALSQGVMSGGDSYSENKAMVSETMHILKTWAAESLETSFQRQVAQMPQDTLEQRRALAHWINKEVRELGLAVACPKTGKPSLIESTTIGGRKGVGSFRFEVVDEDRFAKTFHCYRSKLPDLHLVVDSDERAHWRAIATQRSNTNRRR